MVNLGIHDTFTLKITINETFDHFQCSTLIPRQDRPHKVYISLKLRAFGMYSQQEKIVQAHFELQQYFESGVYHTLNYLGYVDTLRFIFYTMQHISLFYIFLLSTDQVLKKRVSDFSYIDHKLGDTSLHLGNI